MKIMTGKVLWYSYAESRGVVEDHKTGKEYMFTQVAYFLEGTVVSFQQTGYGTARVLTGNTIALKGGLH